MRLYNMYMLVTFTISYINDLEGCFYGNVYHERIVRDRHYPEHCSDAQKEQTAPCKPGERSCNWNDW